MEAGLRERKKQQTREHIAATAQRLFAKRGFEAVTVGDVARAANVAEKTVFNYFPTKEDLFYSRMELFGEQLLGAGRDRPAGESVAAAFRRFVLEPRGLLAEDGGEVEPRIRATLRVISDSPALLAREQQVLEGYSASLAELIAAETGATADDVEPRVAADALMAVHRVLIHWVRARVLAGVSREKIARDYRRQARRAFGRLE